MKICKPNNRLHYVLKNDIYVLNVWSSKNNQNPLSHKQKYPASLFYLSIDNFST